MTAAYAIHAGRAIKEGGRYDKFLTYIRNHPGATTREIIDNTDLCAISAIASEIRAIWARQGIANEIKAEFVGLSEGGARIYRYWLIETGSQVLQRELFQ